MTYFEFKDQILQDLTKRYSETAEVSYHKIAKNNDITLDGLTILQKGSNIAPTIYINYYYHEILDGHPYDSVLLELIKDYEKNKPEQNISPDFFTNFALIKPKIAFKLVNQKRNKHLLQDIPFIPYMDLAIVFYCILTEQENSRATFLIYNHHLSIWNISKEDLFHIAAQNTPQLLKSQLTDMNTLLTDLAKMNLSEEDFDPLDFEDAFPMYILTNHSKLNGACCILYPELLENFSNMFNCDIYVLPSSVHEVILVPAYDKGSVSTLNEMVKEVNDTQVSEDEILSDHIYYYSKTSKTLSM